MSCSVVVGDVKAGDCEQQSREPLFSISRSLMMNDVKLGNYENYLNRQL